MKLSLANLSIISTAASIVGKASSSSVDVLDTIMKVDLPNRKLSSMFGDYYKGSSGVSWCDNGAPAEKRGPHVDDASDCQTATQEKNKAPGGNDQFTNLGTISSSSDASLIQQFFNDNANNVDFTKYPTGCYMRDGNGNAGKYFAFISSGSTVQPNGNSSIKPVCKSASTNGSGTGGGSTPPGGSGSGGGSTPPGGSGSGGGSTPPGGSGSGGGSTPPGGSGSGGGSSGGTGGSSGTGSGNSANNGSSGGTGTSTGGSVASVPVPEPDLCDSLNCPKNQCKIDNNGEPYCRCENTWIYKPSEKKCVCPDGTMLDKSANRCYAPTSEPTAAPVDPPVAAFYIEPPVAAPVAAFIIDPPKSPTMSPVASASSVSDDPHFTFPLVNQPNGNGGYKRGDCEWLSKNNATVRKDKYCKETHVYSMCQETCNGYFGDSDITDTPGSNAFKLKIGTSVPCSWLSNNWKKREERRAAYCVDSSICEMASEVGTKCPVACGFTEGYHEYRSCPKSEEEPVIAAIPTPPTALVPAAPSAPSKGSTTGTASSPTKGSTTGTASAINIETTSTGDSSPATSSGKGNSKGNTYAPASSGKGNSKGNTYAPASSGKGNSKGSTGRRLRSGYLRK